MKRKYLLLSLLASVTSLFAETDITTLPNFMSKEKEAGLIFDAFSKNHLPADKKPAFVEFWLEKNRTSRQRKDEFERREGDALQLSRIPELKAATLKIPEWIDRIGNILPYDFEKQGFIVSFKPGYSTALSNVLVLDPAPREEIKVLVPVSETAAKEARQRKDWYKAEVRVTYRIAGPISVNPVQGLMSMGALLIPIKLTQIQIILGDGSVLGETELNGN
jgi:hypothetical protein